MCPDVQGQGHAGEKRAFRAAVARLRRASGEVQDAFIGADTLRLSDAVAPEEQALVVPRTGLEEIHVHPVEFPAQRAGLGIEGLDPVRGAVFELGQDHFPRWQFVGQHARILAPSC